MAEKDSLAMEDDLVSALVALLVPLTIKGRRIPTVMEMKRMTEHVTSVRDQLYVKAMTVAVMIVAVNSRKVPSFSEMPSCMVLAVVVIVPAAAPGGMESST